MIFRRSKDFVLLASLGANLSRQFDVFFLYLWHFGYETKE